MANWNNFSGDVCKLSVAAKDGIQQSKLQILDILTQNTNPEASLPPQIALNIISPDVTHTMIN